MRYTIKIRWPCDCMCHLTVSDAKCHVCDHDLTWDAQGEGPVGTPYQYVENNGGPAVYLDFYDDDGIKINLTQDSANWIKDFINHLKEDGVLVK